MRMSDAALKERFGSQVLAISSPPAAPASRADDSPPFRAGVKISSSAELCSSGWYVNKVGYGNYMMTAGHCGAPPTAWYTGVTPLYMGYTSQSVFQDNAASDAALVTGRYQAAVWSGSPTSNTAALVTSEASSYPTQVCYDGAFTGMVCRANIISTDEVITSGGHTWRGLTRTTTTLSGPLCQGGDSGGPVLNAWSTGTYNAVGIIILYTSSPSQTCWYMPLYLAEPSLGDVHVILAPAP